ncbi:MAG TPA: GAF domain-containing sensor histidine kinase [Conexibacter sp.]|nr:GAF domain-containing sensor histidine kinase [Conexibacter sp.]
MATDATTSGEDLDEQRLRRLIEVGRSLVSERDLEALLAQVLDVARELTGARYAALGVLDEAREALERFVTRGIDAPTHRAIGDLPHGRGILGLLIQEPRPLRLHDLRAHPRSYGFPANHPPMHSFLGVPILIRGNAWGNLYLTDKDGGDFDARDQQTAVILADWAAVAIENASLYQRLQRRRDELEQVVQGLEATTAIARAVGAETQLERVLELIVKRGRALVDARAMVILLRDDDEMEVAACAGEAEPDVVGRRIPVAGSTSGEILRGTRPERIRDVASRLRISSDRLGVADAHTALLVPLEFRSRGLGVLVAFDRIGSEQEFGAEHEQLLLAFAASAATAVATAQTVEHERLRESMTAAEQERRRWARELHDETLQGLAGFQVLLSSALRRSDPDSLQQAVRTAVEQIGTEIEKLRMLITELRPAALDELGLQPAIESLASRVSAVEGLEVETEVSLGAEGERLAPELETAVYRLVQEALTNVVKHAGANRVAIEIVACDAHVDVTISDDGAGFDTEAPREGFGITGMRERVGLADGTLTITSGPGEGTTVSASLQRLALPGGAAAVA